MKKWKVSTPVGNCYVWADRQMEAIDEAVKRKYGRRCYFRLNEQKLPTIGKFGRRGYSGWVYGQLKGEEAKRETGLITVSISQMVTVEE